VQVEEGACTCAEGEVGRVTIAVSALGTEWSATPCELQPPSTYVRDGFGDGAKNEASEQGFASKSDAVRSTCDAYRRREMERTIALMLDPAL